MAVGTVSGIEPNDNWQLVASQAMSGLSTYTFSSLTGYKTYWLVGKGLTSGVNESIRVTLNGDTSGASYANLFAADGNGGGFLLTPGITAARAFSFQIENADKTVPHQVRTNSYNYNYPTSPGDAYIDPVVITSISLRTNGNTNFSGGTVYLYGIAA